MGPEELLDVERLTQVERMLEYFRYHTRHLLISLSSLLSHVFKERWRRGHTEPKVISAKPVSAPILLLDSYGMV